MNDKNSIEIGSEIKIYKCTAEQFKNKENQSKETDDKKLSSEH